MDKILVVLTISYFPNSAFAVDGGGWNILFQIGLRLLLLFVDPLIAISLIIFLLYWGIGISLGKNNFVAKNEQSVSIEKKDESQL